jgi:hypothetical protein
LHGNRITGVGMAALAEALPGSGWGSGRELTT